MKTHDITLTRFKKDGVTLYNMKGSTDWGKAVVTKNFGIVKDVEVESVNVNAECVLKFMDRFEDLVSISSPNIGIDEFA